MLKSRRLRGDSFVLLLFLDERLQTVQEICGALRMGSGGKDRALVFLQDFQPALDIGGMVCARLGGSVAQIGF
jgi:hypothetical protein